MGTNMKIIISTQKADFLDNIDCLFGYGTAKEIITCKNLDIAVYNIKKYFPFILKKELKRIKAELSQENSQVFFDKNVTEDIREEFKAYIHNENCFLNFFPEILRKFIRTCKKEMIEVGIISLKYDKAIFQIIDKLKNSVKTISIITHDDAFFEEISEYAWSKYGISVNLKEFSTMQNKDLAIILNKSPNINVDFSNISRYTIDIYHKYYILRSNYLSDFSSFDLEKLKDYKVKMYHFVEKEHKISNLKWKFFEKKLTNQKKSI